MIIYPWIVAAMNKTMCRAAILSLAVVSTLAVTATPALAAFPTGTGWSGAWRYIGPSNLNVAETIPGAVLSATGTDDGHSRIFTVTLQDTSSTDGKCASISWSDGSLKTSASTCGTKITFQPLSEDGDVSAVLCLKSSANGATSHCNDLDIPSTYGAPYLRAAGWGFGWDYEYPNEWMAYVDLGNLASVDLDGIDNSPAPNQRHIQASLQSTDSPLECRSGTILDTSPASTVTDCSDVDAVLPTTVDYGTYGTPFQGCIWSALVWLNQPDPHLCLTAFVPVPN